MFQKVVFKNLLNILKALVFLCPKKEFVVSHPVSAVLPRIVKRFFE